MTFFLCPFGYHFLQFLASKKNVCNVWQWFSKFGISQIHKISKKLESVGGNQRQNRTLFFLSLAAL